MESKEVRLSHNVWTNKYFAIALGAMMVIFIVHHWLGVLYCKYGSRKPGRLTGDFVRWHRSTRKSLDRTIYGLHIGRWSLYMVYWAINLILILTNLDLGNLNYVGKRLGWVALANLVLLVFFSLRNTPLAPLSGRSYEKLRPLHKTAGYTTIGMMLLHAIVYLTGWSKSGSLHKMREIDNAAGAVAGTAMFVLGISTIGWFVRKSYEVFYIVHVLMFILIMIMVGMHRPDITTHTLLIVIFTSCMWFADRLVRQAKVCWYAPGNHATVTALSGDAVHVRLTRKISCRPGSHVFLWLPSLRLFETHPFTMVSANPPEFVIRVYDGFTRDLYHIAQKKPGKLLRCSVDGGYGQVPDFLQFDRVILVAGGSGASFTFGIALGLLEGLAARNISKPIEFIWAIRTLESLKWFESELAKLQESPNVNVSIHVTQDAISAPPALNVSLSLTNTSPSGDIEMGVRETTAPNITPDDALHMRKGRPDIGLLISDYIAGCRLGETVGVAGCGPIEMTEGLRKAVHESRISGPSITLHTERKPNDLHNPAFSSDWMGLFRKKGALRPDLPHDLGNGISVRYTCDFMASPGSGGGGGVTPSNPTEQSTSCDIITVTGGKQYKIYCDQHGNGDEVFPEFWANTIQECIQPCADAEDRGCKHVLYHKRPDIAGARKCRGRRWDGTRRAPNYRDSYNSAYLEPAI